MAAAIARHRKLLLTPFFEVQLYFIHVAPTPVLARLDGTHDGVFDVVKVLGRVLILGRVTTADVAALHAQPKVDPAIAQLQAFFAAMGMRCDGLDVAEVRAGWHRSSFRQVKICDGDPPALQVASGGEERPSL